MTMPLNCRAWALASRPIIAPAATMHPITKILTTCLYAVRRFVASPVSLYNTIGIPQFSYNIRESLIERTEGFSWCFKR